MRSATTSRGSARLLSPEALDEPRLVARPPGYLLRVEPGELDLERFERLAADGREALAAGDPAPPRSLSGRPRPSGRVGRSRISSSSRLPRVEVERLEELRLAAVEQRIDAELALGRHLALVAELEALGAEHPYRERFRAQLMFALYRCGPSGRGARGLPAHAEAPRRRARARAGRRAAAARAGDPRRRTQRSTSPAKRAQHERPSSRRPSARSRGSRRSRQSTRSSSSAASGSSTSSCPAAGGAAAADHRPVRERQVVAAARRASAQADRGKSDRRPAGRTPGGRARSSTRRRAAAGALPLAAGRAAPARGRPASKSSSRRRSPRASGEPSSTRLSRRHGTLSAGWRSSARAARRLLRAVSPLCRARRPRRRRTTCCSGR